MQKKSFRILNIAAGVLLIIAGVYCLCNQDVAVLSAGLLLGIFMLASGIIEVAVATRMCGVLIGSGWLMLDGVLTVIMSLFLLFNQWFTMLSLPFLFTLWLLFSGISRFVGALDLHVLGAGTGHSADGSWLRVHDGSVGQRGGHWRNSGHRVSAGGRQLHRVCLHRQNEGRVTLALRFGAVRRAKAFTY